MELGSLRFGAKVGPKDIPRLDASNVGLVKPRKGLTPVEEGSISNFVMT
jgi:hypothetical protein